ncbi:MAG: hypothetical protein FD127_1252, partial [Acidimicrobiaceae bacterium]
VSPLVVRALVAGEADPHVYDDKLAVITPMLLVFVPQIVFYGIGMVATAALAARRRFAAAALAPAVNNLIVIVCYLAFAVSRDGSPASLDLDALQFTVLAGGTTLAVVVFTAVPGIVLSAQGIAWRPRWQPSHPAISSLRHTVGWAMLSVVGTLMPTAAAVVLGYPAEGAVAVFAMAFAFFVLPHALVAVPVATALAPRAAEAWQRGDVDETRQLVDRSAQVVVPLLMFAGVALMTLAWPVARVAGSLGQAASQGYTPIAHVARFVVGPGRCCRDGDRVRPRRRRAKIGGSGIGLLGHPDRVGVAADRSRPVHDRRTDRVDHWQAVGRLCGGGGRLRRGHRAGSVAVRHQRVVVADGDLRGRHCRRAGLRRVGRAVHRCDSAHAAQAHR